MTESRIRRDMVQDFARKSQQLIAVIRKAIGDLYLNPPVGCSNWESWHTPHPWETKALTNLSGYQDEIYRAITAFDAGDSQPIEKVGSYYARSVQVHGF